MGTIWWCVCGSGFIIQGGDLLINFQDYMEIEIANNTFLFDYFSLSMLPCEEKYSDSEVPSIVTSITMSLKYMRNGITSGIKNLKQFILNILV